MDSIAPFISPEKDAFYLMGEEKGQERVQKRVIRNLLGGTDMTVEQIADLAEVSVEFVEEVRQKVADSK